MTYFLVILMTAFFATAALADTDSVMGERKCKIAQTC